MTEPVGHCLKAWRLRAKLTQGQVAEGIGYERSYYSRIENGKRGYDQDILAKLASFYRTEPRDLIGRDPGETADLWALVQRLPADDVKRLTEIARTFETMAPSTSGPGIPESRVPRGSADPLEGPGKPTR